MKIIAKESMAVEPETGGQCSPDKVTLQEHGKSACFVNQNHVSDPHSSPRHRHSVTALWAYSVKNFAQSIKNLINNGNKFQILEKGSIDFL